MRHFFVGLAAAILFSFAVDAAVPVTVPGVQGAALGFQQLTPVAATSLTPPSGATLAVVVCDTAACTWRDDGTAPTASVGMVWPVGVPLYYAGNLSAIQFISATGHVDVSYYK